MGFVLLAIATPNSEKAFKALVLKTLSLLPLLIMLVVFFHNFFIQIAMKFLDLDYMIVGEWKIGISRVTHWSSEDW